MGAGIEVSRLRASEVQEDHSAFWKFPCSSSKLTVYLPVAGNEFLKVGNGQVLENLVLLKVSLQFSHFENIEKFKSRSEIAPGSPENTAQCWK